MSRQKILLNISTDIDWNWYTYSENYGRKRKHYVFNVFTVVMWKHL